MTPARGGGGSLQGALDMLILHTLTAGPMHGYGISQHIGRLSDDVLKIEQGSLYPALDRLQRAGLVTSSWRPSPTGRRARYYAITASGRKRLGVTVSEYERIALAIARVIQRV
jgi:transcriptional regulator